MSTQYPELFAQLAAPFDAAEVKVRSQSGRQLHYITARVAMNRLDNVLGPENWWDDYTPGENSVLCKLTIRLPDGSLLTKQDAGGYAGMADSGDDDKSGYSDAFKRSSVKFGVGRYLYRDGVPTFVQERVPAPDPRDDRPPDRDDRPRGGWSGADNAAGRGRERREPALARQDDTAAAEQGDWDKPPRTGRALFAWCSDVEKRRHIGMVKYLQGFGKLQGFPGRMVDWSPEQVAMAHAEAVRKLQTVQEPDADAYVDALAN